jgi:hypothetical protein
MDLMNMDLQREVDALRPSRSLLFHYTSQSTLLKIVQGKSLWASNIHYLNDATEYKYAFSVLESVLDAKIAAPSDELEQAFLKYLRTYIDEVRNIDVYVFCFSQQPDLLSQWRGYCPNGSGFSVAFLVDDLRRWAEKQDFFLSPCLYEPGDQRLLVLDLVNQSIAKLRAQVKELHTSSVEASKEHYEAWVRYFATNLFPNAAPRLKHPDFREEVEWRLISNIIGPKNPQLGFRPGTTTITPYVDFKIGTKNGVPDIAGVIIGPTPHPELAERALRLLFQANRLHHPFIEKSTIPFRTW